ncbi:hypothetical protein EVAR_29931_1 [Eumeta japonica]|uniref:Uncharacterized protein n=1 Tax=Eumeta variegata TaxID=151549 RepID=A0A4C1V9B1_EUMVA|nr:hypothetical protein EVAR_29931_1 [Eumeta japonica]
MHTSNPSVLPASRVGIGYVIERTLMERKSNGGGRSERPELLVTGQNETNGLLSGRLIFPYWEVIKSAGAAPAAAGSPANGYYLGIILSWPICLKPLTAAQGGGSVN